MFHFGSTSEISDKTDTLRRNIHPEVVEISEHDLLFYVARLLITIMTFYGVYCCKKIFMQCVSLPPSMCSPLEQFSFPFTVNTASEGTCAKNSHQEDQNNCLPSL